MKKSWIILPFLLSTTTSAETAPISGMKYKGHFQFRLESAKNQKGTQGTNQAEQSEYRFRPYLTFSPNENLDLNMTPQATKGFGKDSAATVTTSGSTNHTDVSFYEANINYKVSESFSMKLGRQELAYGDHLIIGSLPWANTARSFDALKLSYKFSMGWTDVVYSKISDNMTPSTPKDDIDLLVLYNSFEVNDYLKPLDIYFIHQDDDTTNKTEINTLGFRIKGSVGSFFYRTENAIQKGSNVGEKAFQYDLEVGGKFGNYSTSLEFASAGENYRQLYPTAHKFLGFADVLGRRNVTQLALHFVGNVTPWLGVNADYHMFSRTNKDITAYKLTGVAWGANKTASDIGNEFDLVLTFKSQSNINLQLGSAWFMPGQYMKDQTGKDETTHFTYAQVQAKF